MPRKSKNEQLSIEAERLALQGDQFTISDCNTLLAGSTLDPGQRIQAIEMRAVAGLRMEARRQRRIKEDRERVEQKKFAHLEASIKDLQGQRDTKSEENEILTKRLASQEKLVVELRDAQGKACDLAERCRHLFARVLSYQDTPECKRDVLIAYLDAHGIKHVSDRCAALLIMITDKSLDQEQRRNFAFEIVQKHHNVRHQEPYRSFVDEVKKELSLSGDAGLEPDSQRWNREIGDDPESLLKVAAEFTDDKPQKQKWAGEVLRLGYGFTDLSSLQSSFLRPSEWDKVSERVRLLKRLRSAEVIENIVEAERIRQKFGSLTREQREELARQDSAEAENLRQNVESEDPVVRKTAVMELLENYRRCSNCTKFTHIEHIVYLPNGGNYCWHQDCGRQQGPEPGMTWQPPIEVLPELHYIETIDRRKLVDNLRLLPEAPEPQDVRRLLL